MTDGGQQFGKYRILGELGAGGFATVYKAVDTTLDREVALKILHPPLLTDRRFVQNFRLEAKTLAALRHPQIITVYEVGEVDGRLFIAMDLAHGLSLAKSIAQRGRIPWNETLALLKPVCNALDYAHGQNVVHRDLKPANLLLDTQRGALLTDFGFARLMAENSASMSMSGGIVGTPGYIAPEVWENNAADAPVDIYALGCVVYEMLTSDVLFKGQTPIQAMRGHDRGPQFPVTWPEDVPQNITAVLGKALARDPATRYSSAGALWQALNNLETQEQVAQEAAQRTALAAQWRAEAERALAAKDVALARKALESWRAVAPNDPALHQAQAKLGQQVRIAREAAQWRAEAEQALTVPDVALARKALESWRAIVPDDPAIRNVQAQLEHLIATPQLETEISPPSQPKPAAQEQALADVPTQIISPAPASPAVSKLPTVLPPMHTTAKSQISPVGQGGGLIKIISGIVGLAIVVFLGVLLVTNNRSPGITGAQPTALFVTAITSATAAASVPTAARTATIASVTAEAKPTPKPTPKPAPKPTPTLPAQATTAPVAVTPEATELPTLPMPVPPENPTEVPTTAPSQADAARSQIAFGSDRDDPRGEIYLMNVDGTGVTRLTNSSGGDENPAWSPDGSKIAFQSDHDGNYKIYVMNADGSGRKQLTDKPSRDLDPAWSPDGKRIVFQSDRDTPQGSFDIYTMNADGSGQTRLTTEPAYDGCPDWSPDGGHIAFLKNQSGKSAIYVMNPDGSEQQLLADNASCPVWSPDGIRIAFASGGEANTEIYVMNADGSGQTNLTNNPASDFGPTWSPDGTRLAFSSDRDRNADIYVMNADGTEQINVTKNSAGDSGPAWRPKP